MVRRNANELPPCGIASTHYISSATDVLTLVYEVYNVYKMYNLCGI